MPESVTLRTHLVGALNDLVESASLGELGKCSVVCELVSLVVDYHEEGTSLFLDVFLTESVEALTAPIPQSARLRLGSAQCDDAGIRKAVKTAAPLVRGCWTMYMSPENDGLHFGLFRDSGHPLNVPFDLTLTAEGGVNTKFIRITRLAQDAVRVSTHEGKQVVVHFTNALEGVASAGESLSSLCEIICSGLDDKHAQTCKTYLAALLSKALRESHGSLIAVVGTSRIPAFLGDCTKFKPPINLAEAVDAARRDGNAIPQLHAMEEIVCGMFCSDGVVVFDTKANVLAYNAFIRLKASNVVGGARRRAYQTLCDKVGHGIRAAFFQSQDGGSDLRRTKP